MKKYLKFMLWIIFGIQMAGADGVDWNKWHKERKEHIAKSLLLPDEKKIANLGMTVGALHKDDVIKSSPERDRLRREIFLEAQSELLKIEGHARYFDKRIREAYEDYRNPKSPRYSEAHNRLSREMHIGYRAFAGLPSPETIQVLGEMLSETWVKEETKDTYYELSSLAVRSVVAISKIGIVGAPTPLLDRYSIPETEKALPLWQTWYEEVKAGKRWVAFYGQSLEYRFNPDGTWESRPTSHTEPTKPKFPTPPDETNEPVGNAIASDFPAKSQPLWPWITGGILLLAAFFFLVRRKFSI